MLVNMELLKSAFLSTHCNFKDKYINVTSSNYFKICSFLWLFNDAYQYALIKYFLKAEE